MRKPDSPWQRIAFVVGAGLFCGVMGFIFQDVASSVIHDDPTWDVTLAGFLVWMLPAPIIAAGLWVGEQHKSSRMTKKQVKRFGTVLLPAVFIPLGYNFFHSPDLSASTQAIFLAAISVWTLFALWVTGQFAAKRPVPPTAER